MSKQYLTVPELNTIQGLLHYLNTAVTQDSKSLTVEARVIDSNGEFVGQAAFNFDVSGYVFEYEVSND